MGVERRVFDSMDDELHKLREIRCDYKSDPLCIEAIKTERNLFDESHLGEAHCLKTSSDDRSERLISYFCKFVVKQKIF